MAPIQPSVATGRLRASTWPWAAGAILSVLLVVAGALVGHHLVAVSRLAAARVPARAVPLATVTASFRPEAGAAFAVPTGALGRLLLLAGPAEPVCPPVRPCSPAPALDRLLILDAPTGAILAQASLDAGARHPLVLAADPWRGLAAIVSAGGVELVSTTTGVGVGGFALPPSIAGDPAGGAAITAEGLLLLAARQQGQPILLGLEEASGAPRLSIVFSGATRLDGPVYDAADGLAVVLVERAAGPLLAAYSATSGQLLGVLRAPAGARLGPLEPATGSLHLFGADGTTWSLTGARLAAAGSESPAGADAPAAPLVAVPALRGAEALGWNAALEHVYVADASGLRVLAAASGKTLAALPLPVVWAPDVPLPVDEAAGWLFVPSDHGELASVRDASIPAARTLTPITAALLARAAVARLLPQGDQDPPMVTPATFTAGPGTRAAAFWIFDAGRGGWLGPYPGTARLRVVPAPAASGGSYDVTFTVTWDQLFTRARAWVERVGPDGAVWLVRDVGDALP